jgi:hypothetical protein
MAGHRTVSFTWRLIIHGMKECISNTTAGTGNNLTNYFKLQK